MIIETPRLRLKIIESADAQAVFDTLNFQRTAQIISFFNWPMTAAQAEMWAKRTVQGYAAKTEFMFLAWIKESGAPVGCVGVHRAEGDQTRAETGYWVSENFQRLGYAMEMLDAAIKFAFGELRVDSFFATTTMDNEASLAVLTKSGFAEAGTKDVKMPDGSLRPSRLFIRKSGGSLKDQANHMIM